jgi:apolipoprotein D and lipocalin family protein
MINHIIKITTACLLSIAMFLPISRPASAQAVTAVPKLDLNRYIGTWYEMARYPIKREKECTGDEMMLYALGDKPNSFLLVTSCAIKADNSDSWNAKGKQDKAGDGQLNTRSFWPFSTKYWVLATGPAYEWALVGSPNRKSLWILSRTPTLKTGALAEIEAKATAQGFNTANLVQISQHN